MIKFYLIQNEIESAEKYAEIARESDSYNPAAFVNLGNCHFQRGDVEKAKVRDCTMIRVGWGGVSDYNADADDEEFFRSCTWWRWTTMLLVWR